MTTTTKELLKEHNELARKLGVPELTIWKAGKDKLAERIDGLARALEERVAHDDRYGGLLASGPIDGNDSPGALEEVMAEVEAELEVAEDVDPLDLGDAEASSTSDETEDQGEAAEEPGEPIYGAVEASGTLPETQDWLEATRVDLMKRHVGRLLEALLTSRAGYPYDVIVDEVRRVFPDARTTRRSVASTAARYRRQGVEVAERRRRK